MAESPPTRKFMFNKSFDMGSAAPTRAAERKPVTLNPDQFDALKKESYDAGVAAGQKTDRRSRRQSGSITDAYRC